MKKIIPFLLIVILMTACGEKRQAKTVVKEFLDANLTYADYQFDVMSFDSTFKMKEGVIETLRMESKKDKLFKPNIHFAADNTTGKYTFSRVMVIHEQDTLMRTFYFNKELTQVIAFKEN